MTDITITKINEVWMKVSCSEVYMELDIQDAFSFYVKNYKHDPLVKAGKWDGIKKMYNRKTKRMYCGLLFSLLEFCHEKGYNTYVDPEFIPTDETLDDEDLKELYEFINPHDDENPISPYDYQHDALKYMLNMERQVCLAATSAGKSLIIYLACRIYQLLEEFQDKRIFIVVPSISLVEQMYSDFQNFSTYENSNWSVSKYVQRVSEKYSKQIEKQIIITTWQSMDKMPHWIYEDMGAVFVDEVHTASANTLTSILERATRTSIRHGLTGTLDGTEANEMAIRGLLGQDKRFVSARDLIDQGRASDLEIHMSMIEYPEFVKKDLHRMKSNLKGRQKFETEINYINSLEYRRDFLFSMFESMPGNSLVLFDRVEGYGRELYEEYKKIHPNTFLIIGEVKATDREDIRKAMENYNDAVIFASYATMQQGVSIKKLHNLFLVSSSKSVIRILQSLGRLMRLHESKDIARIFDIVDNLTFNNEPNYFMQHAEERIKFYDREKHHIKFDTYQISHYMNKNQSIDQFI